MGDEGEEVEIEVEGGMERILLPFPSFVSLPLWTLIPVALLFQLLNTVGGKFGCVAMFNVIRYTPSSSSFQNLYKR